MGVKRAMDRVLSEARKNDGPQYTLGPLIHNRHAVEMLEKSGIKAIQSIDEVSEGTVIIRAHGIPPETRDAIEEAGLRAVDATCPHVRYSQNVVRKHHREGCKIIIAGDKDHAEVVGLLGYCNNEGIVVSSPEEARGVRLDGDVCLIAQTTFHESAFWKIAEAVKSNHENVEVVDTICRSTEERQREVIELCKSVDAMVVVGGKHSANTRRLAKIAESAGTPTVHVEAAADLPDNFSQYPIVGVTAGASTPTRVTALVLRRLQELGENRGKAARALHRCLKFLTNSTLYTGMGAVALTYAAFALQAGDTPALNPLCLVIAFCYIFSVHIWNRMGTKQLDDVDAAPRVAFYARHPKLLVALTCVLAGLSLFLAGIMGISEAALLLAAYVIGLAYNASLEPLGLKHTRLRDLPASKDFFTATGWTAAAVVIPAISHGVPPQGAILASAVAFVLVFVRSTMFDFTDIQGDRLLGRETLPALLGARRTRIYLAAAAVSLAVILTAGAALGILSTLGYWLLPCPAFILLVLYPLFKRVVKSDIVCPLVADGFLVTAGVIALLWQTL